jgi:ComF family protein
MLGDAMGILDVVLPPACAGCGRAGSLLCARCLASLRAPSQPEDRFVAADAGVVIGAQLAVALAAFAYEGTLRRALAALKYTGAARLAPILAQTAGPAFGRLLDVAGPAALVPVPVHAERRRERGYNQAELVARALGRRASLATVLALRRVRPTTKQHRLDRAARLRNLRDAFAASGRAPPVAILVDDIITTAATLEACASVLREAGSREVYGFAVAREV